MLLVVLLSKELPERNTERRRNPHQSPDRRIDLPGLEPLPSLVVDLSGGSGFLLRELGLDAGGANALSERSLNAAEWERPRHRERGSSFVYRRTTVL